MSPAELPVAGTALRCVVIDDDPLSRRILETHIGQTPQVVLVACLTDGLQLLKYLQTQPPVDVLFLDVEMPLLSGLEVLELLPERPAVVLTTTHPEFAVEAFAQRVVDYLVKPIEYARFLKTIQRLHGRQPMAAPPPPATTPALPPDTLVADSFFLKTGGRLVRIPYAEIIYAEAVGRFAVVKTTARQYSVGYSLMRLIDQLPALQFRRVHRSYVVNCHHIDSVDDENNITLHGGDIIPIGRTYVKDFWAFLGESQPS